MKRKKTTVRVGPFSRDFQKIHQDDLDDADEAAEIFRAALDLVRANGPAGRIATWRPHADRLEIAGDVLDQAEALIDDAGQVANLDRFDALMQKAEMMIERAQHAHLNVYGLAARSAKQSEQLGNAARNRNTQRSRESAPINAKLIAWDDELTAAHRKWGKKRIAEEIIKIHGKDLPERFRTIQPESLARRIKRARK